jgi:hypothetical protein
VKSQRPIIHARDHACGGADPIPGLCDLFQQFWALWGGGGYVSQQVGVFDYNALGVESSHHIDNWPTIHVIDCAFMLASGSDLFAQVTATAHALGNLNIRTITPDSTVTEIPIVVTPGGGLQWPYGNRVAGGSTMILDHSIYVGVPVEDIPDVIDVNVVATSAYYGFDYPNNTWIQDGVLSLQWVGGGGMAGETPVVPGRLYAGAYPLMNSDIADAANLDPTKLSHPGGTSQFLRGDGTWSAATFQVEY